jgi:hypothetical protein
MRRFKKNRIEPSIAELTARLRGFLLDSQINDAHEISQILGCGSISEEVADKEEEESEKRLDEISHLMPLIYAYSQSLSQGAIEYQRTNLPAEFPKVPDEMWWESRKLMEQVSQAAILGTLAQLVDMGLLQLPKRYR